MSKTNLTNLNKVSLLAYLINLGISVPHYCYHNNLSIAGNCRMCIVEMGNLNKPVVACAVSAGTSIFNHEIYHNSGLVRFGSGGPISDRTQCGRTPGGPPPIDHC